ncbi:glycosyltransferase family 4 protein [Oscillatoria sp. FACHB-1407]|uniref:glycosyltransferase family 4 protein n=1 Tax=Oscillatoria sp. FACHB-1407 TaxID=2692847 RepID=UPI001686424D|nr:glycosyltransferase family 4 protein [Oscillatoria sp. FACHB-1407]MBD2459691.1 glycosyltransferase family 4 protein [Oscillatoria sp. FACHB-1407]
MKVLQISESDIDGGAARAAHRLHQGLSRLGVNSQVLVQRKLGLDSAVIAPETKLMQGIATARITFDALPLKLYRHRSKNTFSVQWLPDGVASQIARLKPDLINLHWVNLGYLQIETLARLKQPIVWSLHDMWAFTGGCHYNQECDHYQIACGKCPQLGSHHQRDLSHQIWRRKAKAWGHANLTIVALSSWMAECAAKSSLFCNLRIETIPNGLNTDVYHPIDKQTARHLLQLPQDKQIILFGSLQATSDSRKGFHLLQPALRQLSQTPWGDRLELVVFGASQPQEPPDFGFKAHYLGTFNDDLSLALVYSAADVFVLPSTQENLANTVMEAIACGTPCVAFKIGGTPDMIEHHNNGYLAKPYEVEDLAQGIVWVLDNEDRYRKLSMRAREKAEQEFSQGIQAHRYLALFNDLIDQKY